MSQTFQHVTLNYVDTAAALRPKEKSSCITSVPREKETHRRPERPAPTALRIKGSSTDEGGAEGCLRATHCVQEQATLCVSAPAVLTKTLTPGRCLGASRGLQKVRCPFSVTGLQPTGCQICQEPRPWTILFQHRVTEQETEAQRMDTADVGQADQQPHENSIDSSPLITTSEFSFHGGSGPSTVKTEQEALDANLSLSCHFPRPKLLTFQSRDHIQVL